MAESDQISRKRMRFSSSSAHAVTSQILTRSKSQIHIHNNGSGRTRSPSSRPGNGFLADLRQCSSFLREKLETKLPREYPRVTIKDLRLRRVFSPASVPNEWDFRLNGEDRTKEQDKEPLFGSRDSNVSKYGNRASIDGLGASRDDPEEECLQTTPPDTEIFRSQPVVAETRAQRIDQEIKGSQGKGNSGSAEKKSDNYLRSKPVLNRCSRAKFFKTPGSFSYRRLLPYLMEVAEDATSDGWSLKPEKPFDEVHQSLNLHAKEENGKTPNAESEDRKEELGEFMVVKDQYAETKHVLQPVHTVFNKSSAEKFRGSISPLNKGIGSSPNRKLVQEQFSRRKLFRTPGSVNYRRLLPYFTDIPEDNSCVPKIGNHPEPQKSIKENSLTVPSVSDNEGAPDTVTSNVIGDTCSESDPGPEPCQHVSESQEMSDPDKEQETQVKHVIPDSEKNLDIPHQVPGLEMPLSSFAGSRCSSDVATSVPDNSSIDTIVEQMNSNIETRNSEEKMEGENNAEEPEADGLNSNTLLLEASVVSLGTPPPISPPKGILKRNARGCRGLCTCLNCSSFRLHAERAFEFSRNQMQDTEEMVLDLVGEISYLRGMLEKSASADHTVLCTSQVKEACRRASEVAELAKSRLHQINDDLQVHCRIPTEQRARVKFARCIQEKTIPRMHEPEK